MYTISGVEAADTLAQMDIAALTTSVIGGSVTTATASQTVATDAQTAYDVAPSQELATTFNTAATQATTDADAVTTAAATLQTAATATTTIDDDAVAATAAAEVGTLADSATTAIGNYVNEVENGSGDNQGDTALTGTDGVDNFTYNYAGIANILDGVEVNAAGRGVDGTDVIADDGVDAATMFTLGTDKITFNDVTGTITDAAGMDALGIYATSGVNNSMKVFFAQDGTEQEILRIEDILSQMDANSAGVEYLTDEDGFDVTITQLVEILGTDNVSFTAEIA